MKRFIILLFGVLFFSCQSDFKKLGEDDEYIYGIHTTYEYSKREDCYIFTFERKLKSGSNADIIKDKLIRSKNSAKFTDYSYTLMRIKYDFEHNKECMISICDYDSKGNCIYTNASTNDHFVPVMPDDRGYAAAKELFSDSKK